MFWARDRIPIQPGAKGLDSQEPRYNASEMKPAWLWNYPYLWLSVWILFLAVFALLVHIIDFLSDFAGKESECRPEWWNKLY